MHADPKELEIYNSSRSVPELRLHVTDNTLEDLVRQFFKLLRLSVWRAFQHDALAVAKASAYSSILTFFPLLVVPGSLLATSRNGVAYLRDRSDSRGRYPPPGI